VLGEREALRALGIKSTFSDRFAVELHRFSVSIEVRHGIVVGDVGIAPLSSHVQEATTDPTQKVWRAKAFQSWRHHSGLIFVLGVT